MYTKRISITLSGAAIFSAISLVLAITLAPIIPRVPGWGIALIDPTSIVWVLCFLIFGFSAGIICSIAGFIGLFYVDPFVPWGPIFKLTATLPLLIIPYIILKIRYNKNKSNDLGETLSSIKKYSIISIPSIITRCILMLILNISYIFIIAPFLISTLGGPEIIAITVLAINIEQSIWDLFIPWIITYPTGLYNANRIW